MGAGTDGRAVDGNHRWFVELPQLADDGLYADAQGLGGGAGVEPLAACLSDGRRPQVHPRAEGITGAREEGGPDSGIAARVADRGEEVVAHLDRQGVLRFGAVEGDGRDAVVTRCGADHGCDLTHRAQLVDSPDGRHKPHSSRNGRRSQRVGGSHL